MEPKFVDQCQNWPSPCIMRDLYLCHLSKVFLAKCELHKLLSLHVLNLKMSIREVTGVSFGSQKRPYTTKSQDDATINQILKTPTQLKIIRLLSIFVHIRNFCLLVFYISPK